MRQNVHVDLGARAYDVEIGPGLIATAGSRRFWRGPGSPC